MQVLQGCALVRAAPWGGFFILAATVTDMMAWRQSSARGERFRMHQLGLNSDTA